MKGFVDVIRRPVLPVTIHGTIGSHTSEAFLDTGFNGFLAVPATMALRIGLVQYGRAVTRFADGRAGVISTYDATNDWLGGRLRCQAVESQLDHPLIGTALLDGRVVVIDFGAAKSVEVR